VELGLDGDRHHVVQVVRGAAAENRQGDSGSRLI
jgi:hypothetical protein